MIQRMRAVICVALAVGAGANEGCRSTDWRGVAPWSGPSPHETSADPTTASPTYTSPVVPTSSSQAVRVVDLSFDVVRAEIRVGDVRHSAKIWNHLDELRLDSRAAANLVRNGFRVGVGTPEAWLAIRTIFETGKAEVFREQLVAPRGKPVGLDLGPLSEGESIFAYSPSGRLVGKTFPAGRRIINVDYLYRAEQGGSTDIQLGFEVRRDHGVMTWERRGGVIRQVPSVERHVFAGLDARVSLTEGEFLVVGVNAGQDTDYLVGNRFLATDRAGETYETVLFLTPKTIEVEPAGLRGSR